MYDFLNSIPYLTAHSNQTSKGKTIGIQSNYYGVGNNLFGLTARALIPSFINSLFKPTTVFTPLEQTVHSLGLKNILNSTLGKNAIAQGYNLWQQNQFKNLLAGLNLLGNLGREQQQFGFNLSNRESQSYSYNPNGYLNFLQNLWL